MKNIKKFIVLLFICLLLCMPMFSYTIAADEDAELTIVGKNLSYSDSIYLVFAAHATSDVDMKLLVWTEPQKNCNDYIYGTQTTILSSMGSQNVKGMPCNLYAFPISAMQMADNVYVRAYAKVDGKDIYSELHKYSALEYAYTKLGYIGTSATDDQNLQELLKSMLTYGAAAQTYFQYNTENLVTADQSFYKISLENGFLDDGTSYGLYKPKTVISLNAPETDSDGDTLSEWRTPAGDLSSVDNTYTVSNKNETLIAKYYGKKTRKPAVGEIITFGKYEQDNNLQNGSEEIEWIVLESDEKDNKALVLSKYGLERYRSSRYQWNDNLQGTDFWHQSYPCQFLNSYGNYTSTGFYSNAFTDSEKEQILVTDVDSPGCDNAYFGLDKSRIFKYAVTQDKIFLLSPNEVDEYKNVFPDSTSLRCSPSLYAISAKTLCGEEIGAVKSDSSVNTGKYVNPSIGTYKWLLRSPKSGTSPDNYGCCYDRAYDSLGKSDSAGGGPSSGFYVLYRPAMWITLDEF